jgi:hypothetical protein
MHILIDSNIIIEDFRLSKSHSVQFFKYYKKAGLTCHLSEISLREIESNFRSQLTVKVSSYNSAASRLNGQISAMVDPLDQDFIENEVIAYVEYLKGKLLGLSVHIQPIPDVSHGLILEQSFYKKKPFDNKDNGYKDFLILQTAFSIAKAAKSDVIILTKDTDFGNDEIHPDLQDVNTSGQTLILRNSISSFIDKELSKYIIESSAKLQLITDIFDEDQHRDNYVTAIFDEINVRHVDYLPEFITQNFRLIYPPILLAFHAFPETASVVNVRPITEELIIVEVHVRAYMRHKIIISRKDRRDLELIPNDALAEIEYLGDEVHVNFAYWYELRVIIQSDISGENIIEFEIGELDANMPL